MRNISVIVAATSRAQGMKPVLGRTPYCLEGSVCLNGAPAAPRRRQGGGKLLPHEGADPSTPSADAAFPCRHAPLPWTGATLSHCTGRGMLPVGEPQSGERRLQRSQFRCVSREVIGGGGTRRGNQDSRRHGPLGRPGARGDYPDGTWCTDPARVPTEMCSKVTVSSARRYQNDGAGYHQTEGLPIRYGNSWSGTAGCQRAGRAARSPQASRTCWVYALTASSPTRTRTARWSNVCAAGVDRASAARGAADRREDPAASGGGYHRKDSRHGAGTRPFATGPSPWVAVGNGITTWR